MTMTFQGRVHRFSDEVNTDVILPGRYLALRKPEELGRHCLEGLDPDFIHRVKPGDILAVGRNFGCGSSREHAVIALKAAGVVDAVSVIERDPQQRRIRLGTERVAIIRQQGAPPPPSPDRA